jgi:hypothetical protein
VPDLIQLTGFLLWRESVEEEPDPMSENSPRWWLEQVAELGIRQGSHAIEHLANSSAPQRLEQHRGLQRRLDRADEAHRRPQR